MAKRTRKEKIAITEAVDRFERLTWMAAENPSQMLQEKQQESKEALLELLLGKKRN